MVRFSLLKVFRLKSKFNTEHLLRQIIQDLHISPQLLATNQKEVICLLVQPRSNVSRRTEVCCKETQKLTYKNTEHSLLVLAALTESISGLYYSRSSGLFCYQALKWLKWLNKIKLAKGVLHLSNMRHIYYIMCTELLLYLLFRFLI